MFSAQFSDKQHVLQMLDEMPVLDTQKLRDIVMQLPDIQGCISGLLGFLVCSKYCVKFLASLAELIK